MNCEWGPVAAVTALSSDCLEFCSVKDLKRMIFLTRESGKKEK